VDTLWYVTFSETPYRAADGRYHFLYCTELEGTGEYYIGKHSTANLDDGYKGSGDCIKRWRSLGLRDRLKTIHFRFFDSEADASLGEWEFLMRERQLNDPLCQNINEGGIGRTSEDMRRTLARPEIKERHIAGVNRRWAKQEERARTAAATLRQWANPVTLANLMAGRERRWSDPEQQEIHAAGQQKRWAKPEERKKKSVQLKEWHRANPDAAARDSQHKKELWADPVWAEKTKAAARAGRAKIPHPNAMPVETPEGVFPSITAAAKHFGIRRHTGARRVQKGTWRYVRKPTEGALSNAGPALPGASDVEPGQSQFRFDLGKPFERNGPIAKKRVRRLRVSAQGELLADPQGRLDLFSQSAGSLPRAKTPDDHEP
jgi:hypothetical protein